MDTMIKRCGRFTLLRTEHGFCSCLTTRQGERWYWHPAARQWTFDYRGSATAEAATVGLDRTLEHEEAGDLDGWHDTPPAHHWTSHP